MTANINNSPPKRTSGLTREDLERHQNDDSSCYAFMQREGLMERLLGHKMLTGRVDSHIVLGFLPFDPKDNLPSRNRKNVCFLIYVLGTVLIDCICLGICFIILLFLICHTGYWITGNLPHCILCNEDATGGHITISLILKNENFLFK